MEKDLGLRVYIQIDSCNSLKKSKNSNKKIIEIPKLFCNSLIPIYTYTKTTKFKQCCLIWKQEKSYKIKTRVV
jgi:hypothetical protein